MDKQTLTRDIKQEIGCWPTTSEIARYLEPGLRPGDDGRRGKDHGEEEMITMFTQEYVYNEKRQFVRKLEEALLCLDNIRGIEYRASGEKCIELVRIDWHGEGDQHEYINVALNSLGAILKEVVSLVQEGWAIGQIRDQERGDKLWDDLGDEDHYGKLPSDAASVMQEVRKRYDELKGEGSYEKELKEFVEKRRRPR
jgi:hypothetical protein